MNKPIGVSEYELTRALPKELQSSLPSIAQIEAELAAQEGDANEAKQVSGKRLRTKRRQQ